MDTIRSSTEKFLKAYQAHSPWLISRYTANLETQIMVKPGIEEVDQGVWTGEGETWSNHRWPYRAGTAPEYTDKKITYDMAKRVQRIGSTWWDFVNCESVAVGLDIDATDSGHAEGTNQLDEFTLGTVVEKLSQLDYVTLLRSTGGKGVHAYVFFEEGKRPKTDNHNEHTQVALAVLEKIREDTGMDLVQQKIVDVKGVILWLWADTSDENHPGFSVIHEAIRDLTVDDVPDWASLSPKKNPDKGNYQDCELNAEHQEILDELSEVGYGFRWIPEFNMAHTHTLALKALWHKRKNEGRPLKGFFETTSSGSTEINCYITPRPGGAFKVARFGNSVKEHESWFVKDEDSWCFFNQQPDPMIVIGNYSLAHDMSSATIEREKLEEALQFLQVEDFTVPEKKTLQVTYDSSTGNLTASCRYSEGDSIPSGWTKNGKKITARIPIDGSQEARTQTYLDEIDEGFRFVIQPDNTVFGWFHKSNVGWVEYPSSSQLNRTIAQQFGKKAVDEVISMMQSNPWKLGNEPFQPEELPGRIWNYRAAMLVCEPCERPKPHPHFDKILNHLGTGLDEAVQAADWTGEWGIENGADYLRFWIASAIKYPFDHLPYLFFFGPQGCGKSIFIETLQMLFPRACGDVSSALTTDFNGELRGLVFCYIEEKNLTGKGSAQKAYEKIKEWTLAKYIQIHTKGKTPYMQPNTMKFVHMANQINSLRIDRDDTRVVAVDVPRLVNPIPKSIMFKKLEEEAPQIIRTLMTTNIPPAIERMRVPHLNTKAKMEIGESSMSDVQRFAAERLEQCPGNMIEFQEFYEAYQKAVADQKLNFRPAGKRAIGSELRKMPEFLVIGKNGKENKVFLGNVKWKGDSSQGGKSLRLLDSGRIG